MSRIETETAQPPRHKLPLPNTPRILGMRDAAACFGVSTTTLKRGWPEGRFPAPVRMTPERVGWCEDEIIDWQRVKKAERNEALRGKIAAQPKAA